MTAMLQQVPMVSVYDITVYDITHWLEKRFRRECRAPEVNVLRFGISQEARRQKRKKAHADSVRWHC